MPWEGAGDPITKPEAERLFAACGGLSPWDRRSNWRWSLVFKGLWYTGFRVTELVQLVPPDVGLGEIEFIPVKTKDRRSMKQTVPDDYTTELRAFIDHYRIAGRRPIFGVGARRVRQVLDQVGPLAGIKRPLHPHLFRHGAAHDLASKIRGSAGEVSMLKAALHHKGKGSQALERYLQPTPAELADAIRKRWE
ncbi:MAG: site-specific integrase [Chloroflexi bacterium]|nr:site-specific integrase [Chloroflexota bacterium]